MPLSASIPLCICGDPQCDIAHGTCHCGCGTLTTVAIESNRSLGHIRGNPKRYYKGHGGHAKRIKPSSTARCICGVPSCPIPFGYCHCGCQRLSPIATASRRKRGNFVGRPMRFIRGHAMRKRPIIESAVPFKIDGVYCRLIPLTQGYHAIVWESDYQWLMQWSWCAWRNKHGQIYAIRKDYSQGDNGKIIGMHVAIMNPPDGFVVDHRFGVTLDNRRDQLRVATQQQNCYNTKMYKNNKTGVKGVCRCGNSYVATIRIGGKQVKLGQRKTLEEAAALRKEAEIEHYGEFARVT